MRPLVDHLLVWTPDDDLRSSLWERWGAHDDFTSVSTGPGNWVRCEALLPLSDVAPAWSGGDWLGVAEGRERIVDVVAFTQALRSASVRVRDQPGDVGAVVLTESSASVMRSPAGLVPWYLHVRPDLVVISTRLAWFERHLPFGFAVDALAHAVAVDGISCIGRRSPLADVEAIPVGHLARIELGSGRAAAVTDYWRPESIVPPRWSRDDVVERGAELRDILIRRLHADLDPSGRNLIGLSGGVDSSSLAALAVGAAGLSLDAFTFLPGEDHPSLPEVDSYVRSIEAVVRPSRHWRFHMTEQRSLDCVQSGPAVAMPVPHPALSFVEQMTTEADLVVYTGGEAADDLFAGPFVLGKDWIENVSAVHLARSLRHPWHRVPRRFVARQWWEARRGIRDHPLPVDREMSTVFRSELRDEYSQWVAELDRGLDATDHPSRHLLVLVACDGWLRQNWEVSSELGLRRSFPFWCRETLELSLATPARLQARPPKRIIRSGLRDDVPAYNLERVDKGSWPETDPVRWTAGPVPERTGTMLREEILGTTPDDLDLSDSYTVATIIASTRPVV